MKINCVFKKIILFFLFVWLLVFNLGININSTFFESKELLYQIQQTSEIKKITEEYNLDLVRVGNNGIVTFQSKYNTDIPKLLDIGFTFNNISETSFKPGSSRNDDPYLQYQYSLTMMDTINAWDITTGSSKVTVAIIDTGIDIYHDEFVGRISSKSYNSHEKKIGLEAVIDDQGHGTMVAGIIAANRNNQKGIAGIAQNVELLIIKSNIPNLDKGQFYDESIIDGIYYAVDNGAKVINLSLGGPSVNSLMKKAIDYAESKGVAVVAAAGNDGVDQKFYPAAFDNVISVSAVDKNMQLSSYSNFGSTITISAPGSDIYSSNIKNTYRYGSGTSLAAPQVTGVVALIYSLFDNCSLEELKYRLTSSAIDLGPKGWDNQYGYGLVNTYNALSYNLYMVSFVTYDGTKINPIYVKSGDKILISEEPSLIDHFFNGWYLDENFTNRVDLSNFVLNSDINLYAKFTKEYHEVTFITEGSSLNSILVKHGETILLPTSTLNHHDFIGWTIDINKEVIYNPEAVLDDLVLYAKFIPKKYIITFISEEKIVKSSYLTINEKIDFPIVNKDKHYFEGWYLDDSFKIQFNDNYISNDITLYAKFKHNPIQINYYIENKIIHSKTIEYGSILEEYIPSKEGHTFIDWFLDCDDKTVFLSKNLYEDLNLYAKFNIDEYNVRFFNYDNTIFYEETVSYGDSVTTPKLPIKPDTNIYQFTFLGWTMNTNKITSDLDIYPIYQKNYKPDSIKLNLGVDSINLDDEWIDGGVNIFGEDLKIETLGNVDCNRVGQYKISYLIFDNKVFLTELIRFVRVSPKRVEINATLNPSISTLRVGDDFHDSGVSSDFDVEIISNIDTSKPGKYEIKYIISCNKQIKIKTRFVHVLEKNQEETQNLAYIKRKEDYLEV